MPRSKNLRLCAAAMLLGIIPACGEKAEPIAPPPAPAATGAAAPLPKGPDMPKSEAGSSSSQADPSMK